MCIPSDPTNTAPDSSAGESFELTLLTSRNWKGLTAALATVFVEAAAVCLHHHRPHNAVVDLYVQCPPRFLDPSPIKLTRPDVTPQMIAAHKDLQEATERGATGVACLLAYRELGYEVLERARKRTGVDYWLSKNGDQAFAARLEISGILSDPTKVSTRQKTKITQSTASAQSALPVVIAIVEFSTPVAVLEVST